MHQHERALVSPRMPLSHTIDDCVCVQDQVVVDLRNTIRTLKEDVKSLAGALQQMSCGAEVTSVLQALPPTLLQDALRYGNTNSAPATGQQRARTSGVLRNGAKVRPSNSGGRLVVSMSKRAIACSIACQNVMLVSLILLLAIAFLHQTLAWHDRFIAVYCQRCITSVWQAHATCSTNASHGLRQLLGIVWRDACMDECDMVVWYCAAACQPPLEA